jgi:dihydroorotase
MDILISGDKIQALIEPGTATRSVGTAMGKVFDARGLVILSGVLDTHVHFNTGTTHRDTIQEATRAAALGGTTTILGHVRSTSGDIVGEVARQRTFVKECPIDVAFHAILTAQDDLADVVPALIKLGVRSFKLFMTYQREGLGMDDQSMYLAFKAIARAGGLPVVHAENPGMIAALEDELAADGRTAITDFPASRPVFTEVEAVRRALWLAGLARCPVCFAHISSPESLALIATEREDYRLDAGRQQPVYAESCPKYMLLNDGAYETLGGKAVVAPPLRSAGQQQALFQALLSGAIDTLGSDHSPHAAELKEAVSFLDIRPGAPGVQTMFPVILSRVLAEAGQGATVKEGSGQGSLWALQRTISQRPARVFDLYPRKGWLGPGADADLVFVDPGLAWNVTMDWLLTNAGFTLYEGRRLQGKAVHSMVRGSWVMRQGHLVRQAGGQYLAR